MMFTLQLKQNKAAQVKALKEQLQDLVDNFDHEVASRMCWETNYLVENYRMTPEEAITEIASLKRAYELEVMDKIEWLTKELAALIGVTPSNATIH